MREKPRTRREEKAKRKEEKIEKENMLDDCVARRDKWEIPNSGNMRDRPSLG